MAENKRIQFSTIIRNSDYIVRDHRVHQVRIMPGVTFLDMLYRVLIGKEFLPEKAFFRNILFEEPVATSDFYDKKITIALEQKDNGFWSATASSQKVKDGKPLESVSSKNLQCEIHLGEPLYKKKIDYKSLKEKSFHKLDIDEAYGYARKSGINHFEFMKGLGTAYIGDDYLLGEIHLSPLSGEYLDDFYIHPAFLDSSTIIPCLFYYQEFNNLEHKPSIPLHLEEFRVVGKLTDKCYVYIEKNQGRVVSEDIVYINIELYDQDGFLAAYMKNLAVKQIRKQENITNLELVRQPESSMKKTVFKADETILDREHSAKTKDFSNSQRVEGELCSMIAALKDRPVETVNIDMGFYDQGLDSGDLLKITRLLENKLGKQLYPTLLFEYTNIRDLAEFLKKESGEWAPIQISSEHGSTEDNELGCYYYRNNWAAMPWSNGNGLAKRRKTVVFFNEDQFSNEILRAFQAENNRDTILVKCSLDFGKIDENTYQIRCDRSEDYEELIYCLENDNLFPDQIIFLWSLKEQSNFEVTKSNFYLNNGVYPLFELCKALSRSKLTKPVDIRYLYKGKDPNRAFGAAVGGFAKTVYLENPKIIVKTVELATNSVEQCAREFEQEITMPQQIKIEDTVRYVKHLTEFGNENIPKEDLEIKDDGVYLITGGMGGLGLVMARMLTEQNKVTLILTGRSPLNHEGEVELNRLNLKGSKADYIQADLSDPYDLKALITIIKTKYHEINGIIHCAGAIRDSMLSNKSKEDMIAVLSPKVEGTIALDELTANEPLDFFVMFSSTTAILGNIGQSDYAYANGFLDAFSEERNKCCEVQKRSGRTVAINWSLWETGGMRLDDDAVAQLRNTTGMVPLRNAEGTDALLKAIGLRVPNITVIKGEKGKLQKLIDMINESNSQLVSYTDREYFYEDRLRQQDDIAIIGIGGRYPMASNLEEFWSNLKDGRDCISEIPSERWDYRYFYNTARDMIGKTYSKWGGFMADIDKFDPLFFNIAPRDANWIDPQERLFLETVWETMENAGYTRERMGENSKVGVYVGVMWSEYQLLGGDISDNFIPPVPSFSSIANRVSYFFDFHGPSIALDTMCSSALTAIYLACDSIRRGDCEMAVAGGVNLSLHPNKYVQLSQTRFFSSDGRCRSFGEGGDGYVPGEGVGAVLLKPLSKAIADNDTIYGVVKGISINHGGRANGYHVPSPSAQAETITEAIQKAKIDPRTISYIETHGTGTSLGDPIEINGLTKAFGKFTREEQYCAIGSVKSNIGHLEAAAGIASLTKVLLQFKHKQIVPSLHAKKTNPNIDFKKSPFYVQQQLTEWSTQQVEEKGRQIKLPRRAAISSFGAGGTNVHMILEEYLGNRRSGPSEQSSPKLLVLSAKTKERLTEYAGRLLNYCKKSKADAEKGLNLELSITDMIYTLQTGREAMEERLAIIGNDWSDFVMKLTNFTNNTETSLDHNSVFCGSTVKGASNLQFLLSDLLNNDILHSLIKQRDVKKLALMWIEGITIPWEKLYEGIDVRITALPTYPFERKRYWIPVKNHYQGNSGEPVKSVDLSEDTQQIESRSMIDVEAVIVQKIADIIGVKREDLNVDADLGSYGLDSLTRIQLANELKKIYGDLVTAEEIFEASTIKRLAERINEGLRAPVKLSLPSKDIFSKISHYSRDLNQNNDISEFAAVQNLFANLGLRLLFNSFRKMGWFSEDFKECSVTGIREKLEIKPSFDRLFKSLLEILDAGNVIRIKGDIVERSREYDAFIEARDMDQEILSLREKYPAVTDHMNLLVACVSNYPKILRGEIAATDVMFPGSSMDLVEKIYRGNPSSDYFNRTVAQNVKLYIEERIPFLSQGEKINILEVGAGTGGTSTSVLPVLSEYGDKVSYVYTDISPAFTMYGRSKYGSDFPFMEFKLLDIEKEISRQDFKAGDFEIIIASNVLHATKNIKNVLQNIMFLLSPGGWLILNEATQVQEFLTMTFGLLDGWWLYEDEENRIKGSPLLNLDTWKRLLKEHEFNKFIGLGNPPDMESESLQHVIIAEYGGVKEPGTQAENVEFRTDETLKEYFKIERQAETTINFDEIVNSIRAVVAQNLGMELERLNIEVDLNEYGLDSLTRIRIINELGKSYEGLLSPEVIFEQNTVKKLAEYVITKMSQASSDINQSVMESGLIKTSSERLQHERTVQTAATDISLEDRDIKTDNILITGVTGVLGGRLIKEYLEMTKSTLYCLVRSKNNEQAKKRILEFLEIYDPELKLLDQFKSRVIPVIGDITKPLLGLESSLYDQLTMTIDMVVNSAGKTSLHGLYNEVKDVNLDGTSNIVDFTLKTKQKYLVQISTIGIMGDIQFYSNPPFKECDLDIGQGFDNMGYPKSKLEAEKLVHSMKVLGLRWIIIRPGNIMGDSRKGYYPFGLTKTPGAFYDYFKTAIELKLIIDSPWYFDVTPIDYVSKSVVWLSTSLKDMYQTYHLVNPNRKTVNEIMGLIQNYGYPIRFTNLEEYLKVIKSKDNTYHSITTELMLFSPLTKQIDGFTYADGAYTAGVLAKGGIVCPKIDEKLIKVYLDYCVKVGYLKERTEDVFWSWQKNLIQQNCYEEAN